MKIYVASSWRNLAQPDVVARLRKEGHKVYDFRDPKFGFSWSDIDPNWKYWPKDKYVESLDHHLAVKGFGQDLEYMQWADICVLVLPCGKSAHTEAGWFAGKGKPVLVLLDEAPEPELMYKIFDHICVDFDIVLDVLEGYAPIPKGD